MSRNLALALISSTLVFGASLVNHAIAAEAVDLKVGDPAPEFEAMDDAGKLWKSTDVVGKKTVVIYFYPADMTGGCTKQACGFRDQADALKQKDVVVIGVSGDSVRNHQLFKQAHQLNFPLLADTDGAVAAKFGVPFERGEKSVMAEINGKKETLLRTVTTKRWTFVIDKAGNVAMKNTTVKAAEDPQAVLDVLAKLK
jgi:thioredoxin-dependent peroxiredoxin